MSTEGGLRYEVVVCTRNRPAALAASLPLMVGQNPPPDRVLVVDASDAPAEVEAVVRAVVAGSNVRVELLRSAAGTALQRNAGLAEVIAPIVFFPDDDSMWSPGFAGEVLRIYEADEHRVVGAVTGTALARMPSELADAPTYAMSRSHRVRQRIASRRASVEHRLVPDPLAMVSSELTGRHPAPATVLGLGAEPHAWVTGFRMSFRSAVVRDVGFDAAMERYALYEDLDLGFTVAERHAVVAAPLATLFHRQHPGGRGDGFTRGYTNVLNRAYVVCKHTEPDAPARMELQRYGAYRAGLYGLGGMRSATHRASLRGAVAAARAIRPLIAASPDDRPAVYRALVRRLETGIASSPSSG